MDLSVYLVIGANLYVQKEVFSGRYLNLGGRKGARGRRGGEIRRVV